MTKLDGSLERELLMAKTPYTLTISEDGLTLTLKGRRKGLDIRWIDLVSGDAALAPALNASLTANIQPKKIVAAAPRTPKAPARRTPKSTSIRRKSK